jgi:tetratricopeptide (TPR) repeat protein
VYAIRLFEGVVEASEPFYIAFALAGISQCYNELGHRDLETQTFKRITKLPKQQQLLLNPGWLALCYQKSGDLKEAENIHLEILQLAPSDPKSISALAEIYALTGNFAEAEARARELQQSAEPQYQILGRLVYAFALSVSGRYEEAVRDLSWVGQFLVSSGSIPAGTWDYRDLQPLVEKTGPNAKTFQFLLDAMQGKIPFAEFTSRWAEIMPSLKTA